MQYAHRNFLITVNRAEEDGKLLTMAGEIPVKKGELVGCDLEGNSFVLPDSRFETLYVPVQRVKEKPVKKQLSPFEEQMINAYANYNGSELNQNEDEIYINGTLELSKNKAF